MNSATIVSYNTRDSLGTENHLSDTTELVLEWRGRVREGGRVRERVRKQCVGL